MRDIVHERANPPGRIAPWRLNLDDVRAHVGQELAAVVRLLVGKLQHPQACQRAKGLAVGHSVSVSLIHTLGKHRVSGQLCDLFIAQTQQLPENVVIVLAHERRGMA